MTGDIGLMLRAVIPEIGILVLVFIVLLMDMILGRGKRRFSLGWVTIGGLVVIAVLSILFSRPQGEAELIWGGMLRFDEAGFLFRILFLIGGILTTLFTMGYKDIERHAEYYILLLISMLGMNLMASSADLVMLYLAIETTSIPLYILAGFLIKDQKSVESGIKYLLFGAMTSAVMLYGFSLLYGFTGTTQIYEMAVMMQTVQIPIYSAIMLIVLVMVGFAFKISAVPFHFWAPDVYEGAPTPIAGFLSTASKAAGFAVLLRFMLTVFPDTAGIWTIMVAIIATVSMFLGNLLALAQKNIKRLLAYSSIAQAGYILIGVAANSELGNIGVMYYLMAYLLTNLVAFGVVNIASRYVGSNKLSAYAGLSRRSPGLAIALLVSMLSLAGIPPFGGFIGKFLVLGAAVQSGMLWLAIIGVINSVIALYYYLTVLKVVYLYRSEEEDTPIQLGRRFVAGLGLSIVGIIFLGSILVPLFNWSSQAAAMMLLN
jgi:NADH-quinone oxidoreductase subunit N